ncbi:unnamed protein product [Arctogadus glacialis]
MSPRALPGFPLSPCQGWLRPPLPPPFPHPGPGLQPSTKTATLCLPCFRGQQLLWVHSNSIAQEVAHAADTLDGACRMCSLTPKREEMAKLARRCSLTWTTCACVLCSPPLHYGISWDYVRHLRGSEGALWPGAPKIGERGVVVGGETTHRRKGEEGRGGGQGRQARVQRPRRLLLCRLYAVLTDDPGGCWARGADDPARATKAAVVVCWGDDPQAVSEIPLASKGHRGPPGAGENHAGRKADSTATVSGDDDGVDGVAPGNGSAHGNTSALGDLGTSKAKASPPDAKPKNKTKTKEQLRRAFLACQYPNPCDYDWLSEWTGLQRTQLIQWFGDTRYDMKNTKPRWITPGDQQRVLARMRQRQRMKHLSTGEAGAGREAASEPRGWDLEVEAGGAVGDPHPRSRPPPPEAEEVYEAIVGRTCRKEAQGFWMVV